MKTGRTGVRAPSAKAYYKYQPQFFRQNNPLESGTGAATHRLNWVWSPVRQRLWLKPLQRQPSPLECRRLRRGPII